MTLHNCEIVDCGAFCEVIFFCISPKNLLGDFFDSLAIDLLFFRLQKATSYIVPVKREGQEISFLCKTASYRTALFWGTVLPPNPVPRSYLSRRFSRQ